MIERPPATPLRLLHIEDSPTDSELIHATLEADGFAVELSRVETREAAREALAAGDFDVVVSDFSLPRFNGLEALVLAAEVAPEIPFILVSGTIGEDAAIDSLRGGATDYVLKHRLARLAPAVRRALKESADRRVLHEAERALVRERHFLRAVLESVRTGIIACDAQGTLTLFNRAAREIHGVSPDTPLARALGERFWLLDDEGTARIARLDVPLQRILGGEEIPDTELVVVPRGKPRRRVVVSGRAVTDEGHEKLGAVVAIHDVSEQRDLVEKLRHIQKMEAIGRVVGGVAQDFNNLLTVIIGYAQISARRIASGGDAAQELAEIERAAARGGALTRQLMSFSRTEAIQPRRLDLNAVITEMEDLLVRVLGEGVELQMSLAPGLGAVLADASHIEQIVLNLVIHAHDALLDGGRVTIETSAGTNGNAEGDHRAPAAAVVLTIRDNGVGMDETARQRVFEPFLAARDRPRSAGLGLSTVQGIVRQSGGTIEVESAPGAGTTFRIRFPRVEADGARRAVPAPTRAIDRGSGRVLVVEEDAAVRDVIARALRMQGFTVIEAAQESEAAATIDTSPLDLMVADRVVAGASLSDLAARLATSQPPVRTLFLSGAEESAAAGEKWPGAEPMFLPKPFTVDELIRQVKEAITRPSAEAA